MIHAIIIGALIFTGSVFLREDYPKWSYYGAFLLKAIGTLSLAYYYINVLQEGDTLVYFKEAISFNETHRNGLTTYVQALFGAEIDAQATNWHSVFFIKLIAPIVWLSGNQYGITSLYLTTISFLLTWTAATTVNARFNRQWLIYIGFFCLPSVMVWSGGVFKESLGNALFYLLVGKAISRNYPDLKSKAISVVIGILYFVILVKLRFYLGVIFFSFFLLYQYLELIPYSNILKWSGLLVIGIICFLTAQWFHPWLRPSRLPLTIYENYEAILSKSSSASRIEINTMSASYVGLILSSPLAWFTGWFRPLLWELNEWGWFPFRIEKLSLLFLWVFSVIRFKKVRLKNLLIASLISLTLLSIFLTLTTPNFGSLIRYQSAYTPFLFIILGWIAFEKIDGRSTS